MREVIIGIATFDGGDRAGGGGGFVGERGVIVGRVAGGCG